MLKNYWRHRVVGGTTFIFLAPEAPLGTQQPSSPAAKQPSSSSRPSGGSSSSSVPGALRGWQSALRFNLNKKRISHFAVAVGAGAAASSLHSEQEMVTDGWLLVRRLNGVLPTSGFWCCFEFWVAFWFLAFGFSVSNARTALSCAKTAKLWKKWQTGGRGWERGGRNCVWKTAMQRKNLTTLQHANAWIDFDLAKFLISCSLNFLRCAKVCQAALSPAHSSLKTDRTADTLSATRS